jgi:hypothetical protein
MAFASTGDGDGGSSFLRYAAQLFGLLAGAAAVVYLTGAIVLAGRLLFAQLPAQSVIGQLPRELLIGIGMAQVILPALIIASVYAGVRLWRGERSKPPDRRDRLLGLPEGLAGLAVAALLVAPGVLGWPLEGHKRTGWAFLNGRPERGWPTLTLLAGLAFALTALTVLLALRVRRWLVGREDPRWAWGGWRSIASLTAAYALVLLVPLILVGVDFRLSEAKVCMTGKRWISGVLLGSTAQGIYVGENGARPRRIVFVPDSQIKEVFVGGNAGTARALTEAAAGACDRKSGPS